MSVLPLIIMTHPLPPEWITSLNGRVRLVVGPADIAGFAPHLKENLEETEGILCLLFDKVDSEILANSPRLRVVSKMGVGVDDIDVAGCNARKIPIGITPDNWLTDAKADLTLALLLCAARRVPEAITDAKNGLWHLWTPAGWLGLDVHDATLGIIGMGKIGRAVAHRAQAFGLNVIYTDLEKKESVDARFVSFEKLLRTSDYITIHTPLNNSTRDLIDEKAFRLMKKNAVIINAARGQTLNTDALTKALKENWIAGAALDATDPEPLPYNHPLFDMPNCLITPHIGSATRTTRKRMAEMACENLLAGLESNKLPYCANPEIYE
jgi:glyoxylate reductase